MAVAHSILHCVSEPVGLQPPVRVCSHSHKIWIDLDNSPHVPFFAPIIEELKRRGHQILLTSRDNAQVLELLDLYHLDCRHYGRHYGKHKWIKVIGLGVRALQLAPLILRERPDLALSHGSRSQVALSQVLRIPSIAIGDYEHAMWRMGWIRPQWLMVPEVISKSMADTGHDHILQYPGIKEDVYVPRFRPTPGIREQLGVSVSDLMVTIRPPASDAHYHNPESDTLFRDVVEFLGRSEIVRMVLLPRNNGQAALLRKQWPEWFRSRKMLIPERVVEGLNLLWFSDIVISGGGTMNREAAALGVPVYSIFRGKQAAVDRYLASEGRLVLLETADDLKHIQLARRHPSPNPHFSEKGALSKIVENVAATLALSCGVSGPGAVR